MARMVDDLLDVSRISRGKLELRKARVTLQQVIQGAVETSRPLIDQHHHQLEVSLPDEPLLLDGDLTRLSQVFCQPAQQRGEIHRSRRAASGWWPRSAVAEVVVSVIDSGVGIPVRQMANIFRAVLPG